LNDPIALNANTTYGFALVMPLVNATYVQHAYTNPGATCAPSFSSATGCVYANADLTFVGGSASNIPFSATGVNPLLGPRIWNGSITYDLLPFDADGDTPTVPEPSSILALLAIGTGLLGVNKGK
jgi:hypothetical protein